MLHLCSLVLDSRPPTADNWWKYPVSRAPAQRLMMLYRCLMLSLLLFPMSVLAEFEQVEPSGSYGILKYKTPGGAVLVEADVDWSRYTKVRLERGTVEFREDWVRDQQQLNSNIIRESDIERVKTDMADMLEKTLKSNLSAREAYTLTDESGADVLRFTPGIVKLDIYTPDFMRNYSGSELTNAQGSMVLVLDISDSVSGKVLASAVQKQQADGEGYFDSANRGTNMTAFRRMMRNWNDWLFAMLEKIRAGETE